MLLADGRRLWLPPDAIEQREHGTLVFRGSFEELAAAAREQTPVAVVPVMEEELRVGKRVVETGRVRIHEDGHEHEEVVDEPLMREEYDVERVPIDEFVDGPVGPRHEGETLIVPVLEEVLVVEKRLVVREELRITRKRTEERRPQRVKLLSEEVSVERTEHGCRARRRGRVGRRSACEAMPRPQLINRARPLTLSGRVSPKQQTTKKGDSE